MDEVTGFAHMLQSGHAGWGRVLHHRGEQQFLYLKFIGYTPDIKTEGARYSSATEGGTAGPGAGRHTGSLHVRQSR